MARIALILLFRLHSLFREIPAFPGIVGWCWGSSVVAAEFVWVGKAAENDISSTWNPKVKKAMFLVPRSKEHGLHHQDQGYSSQCLVSILAPFHALLLPSPTSDLQPALTRQSHIPCINPCIPLPHYSAEDQSGRQGQDPAAGGAARRWRVHLPLQLPRRRACAAPGPRQGQGAAADPAAQVQTQGQQRAGGERKVSKTGNGLMVVGESGPQGFSASALMW